jgi:hypothetical protein
MPRQAYGMMMPPLRCGREFPRLEYKALETPRLRTCVFVASKTPPRAQFRVQLGEEMWSVCGDALSMGTDQPALLRGQSNMPEKSARRTNPHIRLLNHRGNNRLRFNAVKAQVASELELRGRRVHPWD